MLYKEGDILRNQRKKYNRDNIKFDKIKITKHAIDQYRTRVCQDDTDDEIINFLTAAVNEGKIKSVRDSIYDHGKNKTEIRFLFRTHVILGILEPNGELSVVTCTGNNAQRAWYRKQVLGMPYKAK